MDKYITKDGDVIRAADARGVVRQLRAASYAGFDSDAEFMRDMAERVRLETKGRVAHDNPDEFLAGLLRLGYLRRAP